MAEKPRAVDNNLDTSKKQGFSQLMQDVNDVFVAGTKKLDSFPPDYQEQLRQTYRFYGVRYDSDEGFIPKISPQTLDLI
jgi:hypothetical protein